MVKVAVAVNAPVKGAAPVALALIMAALNVRLSVYKTLALELVLNCNLVGEVEVVGQTVVPLSLREISRLTPLAATLELATEFGAKQLVPEAKPKLI